MTQTYQTILTHHGERLIVDALANKLPVPLKTMAIGDGNGAETIPKAAQTALVREVYRAEITDLLQDTKNRHQVIAELLIPEHIGGFMVREIGLFDDQGALVAVANCPENYKPVLEQGSGKVQYYRIVLQVSSSDAVTLTLSNNIVHATRVEFEQFVESLEAPDGFRHIGRCKSVAELRTIRPTEHGQRILVDAYYEGGTTGGGEFVADLQDLVTPDDGGVCFIVGNNGGRWIRHYNQLSIHDVGYQSGDLVVHNNLRHIPLDLMGQHIQVNNAPNTKIYNGKVTINDQDYVVPEYPVTLTPHEDAEVDGTLIRYSNFSIGIDAAINLVDDHESYANTAIGTSAMQNVETAKRVTAIGTSAVRDVKQGYSLTAVGANALKWANYADRNTVVGENACLNLGSEDPDAKHGYFNGREENTLSRIVARYPSWGDKYNQNGKSSIKMTQNLYGIKASRNVAIGRNAMGFSIVSSNNVAIGYDALTSSIDGESNVAIGSRVMQLSIDSNNNVVVGANALANTQNAQQVTALGYDVGKNYAALKQNVVLGYQALLGTKATDTDEATNNVAIGRLAMGNSGGNIKFNVGVGGFALSELDGGGW